MGGPDCHMPQPFQDLIFRTLLTVVGVLFTGNSHSWVASFLIPLSWTDERLPPNPSLGNCNWRWGRPDIIRAYETVSVQFRLRKCPYRLRDLVWEGHGVMAEFQEMVTWKPCEDETWVSLKPAAVQLSVYLKLGCVVCRYFDLQHSSLKDRN